ncbi:MAG: hypothetical protein E6Q94_10520 [Burkholderiaceae bacterium]|nr:MAG: hypothetical protein E6Q94_10520 [Burkholderiaceae bacterium]
MRNRSRVLAVAGAFPPLLFVTSAVLAQPGPAASVDAETAPARELGVANVSTVLGHWHRQPQQLTIIIAP